MAYKIQQFRYYGENNADNYPKGLSGAELINGKAFKNTVPIVQLGIQYNKDKPIQFYINDEDMKHPILSHPYGLYELDLTGRSQILSLMFDRNDLGNVDAENPLIIDIVYVG